MCMGVVSFCVVCNVLHCFVLLTVAASSTVVPAYGSSCTSYASTAVLLVATTGGLPVHMHMCCIVGPGNSIMHHMSLCVVSLSVVFTYSTAVLACGRCRFMQP